MTTEIGRLIQRVAHSSQLHVQSCFQRFQISDSKGNRVACLCQNDNAILQGAHVCPDIRMPETTNMGAQSSANTNDLCQSDLRGEFAEHVGNMVVVCCDQSASVARG